MHKSVLKAYFTKMHLLYHQFATQTKRRSLPLIIQTLKLGFGSKMVGNVIDLYL